MFHLCRWTDTRRCWYSEEGNWVKSIIVDGTWRACTALLWSKPGMNCSTTSLLTLILFCVFSQLGSTYFYKWKPPPAEIFKSHSSAFMPIFYMSNYYNFIINWNPNASLFYLETNRLKRYFWLRTTLPGTEIPLLFLTPNLFIQHLVVIIVWFIGPAIVRCDSKKILVPWLSGRIFLF